MVEWASRSLSELPLLKAALLCCVWHWIGTWIDVLLLQNKCVCIYLLLPVSCPTLLVWFLYFLHFWKMYFFSIYSMVDFPCLCIDHVGVEVVKLLEEESSWGSSSASCSCVLKQVSPFTTSSFISHPHQRRGITLLSRQREVKTCLNPKKQL